MSSSPQPPTLLSLPTELRLQIFHHVFVRPSPIAFNIWIDPACYAAWHTHDHVKSLLLVSRQISAEAHDALYGVNLFHYPFYIDDGYELARCVPAHNLARIRQLFIEIQPEGNDMPDAELWTPILGRLTRLVIVAQQPLARQTGYHNPPDYADELQAWKLWCGPVLEFVARCIRKTLVVEVDDDGREETEALVERYFAGRYRKVRTERGDKLFKRGAFKRQKGYWLHDPFYDDYLRRVIRMMQD